MRRFPPLPKNWHDLAALLDPAGLCSDPLVERRPFDWLGVYHLAAGQLVAPHLYLTLASRGRLYMAPVDVREALGAFYQLNDAHNARLRAVLRDTVRALNAQNIEPLLLKGSICLLPDQPWHATARMMSDIDIALKHVDPKHGEETLRVAGYWYAPNQGPEEFRRHHHLAPLFHPSGEGYVEIHRSILSDNVPPQVLPLAEVCDAAELVVWDGLRLWIPSMKHRLLHNALHHQIQDATVHCALRQVLEFAHLRASPAATNIDWMGTLSRLDAAGVGVPFRAYLMVAERLFAQPPPIGLGPSNAARWAEYRMWLGLANPRLFHWLSRASRLPKRLVTPVWYLEKGRHLARDWTEWKERQRRVR